MLILVTLWPQFWDALTSRPEGGADPHAQARELLAGQDITVPATFTATQIQQLRQAEDARLAQAAAAAQDGQVIQFLAGAPELLARYRNAPPAAAALIHAAMDARRLGTGIALPEAFLEAAAPGYLTDAEWDTLSEDWLKPALAYTAKPCKGARGPLTRIRPRPTRSGTTGYRTRDSDEQLASGLASTPGGPLYRLADYLDQHGRTHRKSQIPPASFWAATADHAFPADQAALGDAAHDRGLYRAAAQLHKNAAAHGNLRAVAYLSNPPDYLRPDAHPLDWAVAYVPLDHDAVAWLLGILRSTGADEQFTALAWRAAAHIPVDDPAAVDSLLGILRLTGADEQFTALAGRAAAHIPLDDPAAVAGLRKAGPDEQVTAPPRSDPRRPHPPRRPGHGNRATGQAAGSADEQAAHIPLDDPYEVARLLDKLRKAGAQEQVTALLRRDPATHVLLGHPYEVAWLLDKLREAGADEQVRTLAERAAAHAPLNSYAVAELLDSLREAGADEQADALANRLPGAGMFELFRKQGGRQDQFRFGREADGSAAKPWDWEDLD